MSNISSKKKKFAEIKKKSLGAGPIRPNSLSFSKSIGGFRPKNITLLDHLDEVFCPFLRCISAKKKWSWVAA